MDIESLRREYRKGELGDSSVDPDPIKQFRIWFEQAVHADIDEVNAMTLATSTLDGKPSARIVLLKSFTNKGFTFFTNYEGRKSLELEKNPFAALVIYWKELERQVRIEGRASKVAPEDSNAYFNSRSLESRISAVISPQSQVVESRRFLEELWIKKLKEVEKKEFQRPKNWGGYNVEAYSIEFWQGRPNRLNDRIRYSKGKTAWKIERLAP